MPTAAAPGTRQQQQQTAQLTADKSLGERDEQAVVCVQALARGRAVRRRLRAWNSVKEAAKTHVYNVDKAEKMTSGKAQQGISRHNRQMKQQLGQQHRQPWSTARARTGEQARSSAFSPPSYALQHCASARRPITAPSGALSTGQGKLPRHGMESARERNRKDYTATERSLNGSRQSGAYAYSAGSRKSRAVLRDPTVPVVKRNLLPRAKKDRFATRDAVKREELKMRAIRRREAHLKGVQYCRLRLHRRLQRQAFRQQRAELEAQANRRARAALREQRRQLDDKREFELRLQGAAMEKYYSRSSAQAAAPSSSIEKESGGHAGSVSANINGRNLKEAIAAYDREIDELLKPDREGCAQYNLAASTSARRREREHGVGMAAASSGDQRSGSAPGAFKTTPVSLAITVRDALKSYYDMTLELKDSVREARQPNVVHQILFGEVPELEEAGRNGMKKRRPANGGSGSNSIDGAGVSSSFPSRSQLNSFEHSFRGDENRPAAQRLLERGWDNRVTPLPLATIPKYDAISDPACRRVGTKSFMNLVLKTRGDEMNPLMQQFLRTRVAKHSADVRAIAQEIQLATRAGDVRRRPLTSRGHGSSAASTNAFGSQRRSPLSPIQGMDNLSGARMDYNAPRRPDTAPEQHFAGARGEIPVRSATSQAGARSAHGRKADGLQFGLNGRDRESDGDGDGKDFASLQRGSGCDDADAVRDWFDITKSWESNPTELAESLASLPLTRKQQKAKLTSSDIVKKYFRTGQECLIVLLDQLLLPRATDSLLRSEFLTESAEIDASSKLRSLMAALGDLVRLRDYLVEAVNAVEARQDCVARINASKDATEAAEHIADLGSLDEDALSKIDAWFHLCKWTKGVFLYKGADAVAKIKREAAMVAAFLGMDNTNANAGDVGANDSDLAASRSLLVGSPEEQDRALLHNPRIMARAAAGVVIERNRMDAQKRLDDLRRYPNPLL